MSEETVTVEINANKDAAPEIKPNGEAITSENGVVHDANGDAPSDGATDSKEENTEKVTEEEKKTEDGSAVAEKTDAENETKEEEEEEENYIPDECEGISCKLVPADDYVTTARDGAVKIQFSGKKGTLTASPAISVMEFIERTVNKFGKRVALKVERDEKWIEWTYDEYLKDVKTAAKGFIKLGLEPYNGVGIIGFNSPEWMISDLGAIYAGGLATGIYTTNTAEACQYACSDASCNIVVVENNLQLQKILQVWDSLPGLKAIVQYLGEVEEKRDNVYTWQEFMDIGRGESEEELEKRINMQAPNKCCTLIYTSGTTGNPKGVMVSHDNLTIAVESLGERINYEKNLINPAIQDTFISYLPLSHMLAQLTDIWIPIRYGGVVWFAKPDALKGTLKQTLVAARPTLFVGVPRVFEKFEEAIKGIGANLSGVKKKMSNWAKGVALRGNQNRENGLSEPLGWTIAIAMLKKVRKGLGLDRAKCIMSGGAPISKQTLEFFSSLNMVVYEGYGMSEGTGGVTLNAPGCHRTTSVGHVINISEIKISEPDEDGNGELCFQGRNVFMGYLKNVEKTKETIDDDRWLHSGDIGKIDKDGFAYITGRIKELIVTAGGENIAPVPIEANIKEEIPLVGTAMVIGDKRKFLSCLLTCQVSIDLDTGTSTNNLIENAKAYLKKLGIEATTSDEICEDKMPEELRNAIQEGINNANKKAVSNAAKVQKWKLLPLEFTTAGGELGPTQKLRRPQVMKMYKETIDQFYADL